jgi:hypothetical protein
MKNEAYNVLSDGAWLLYLRKSRADNPNESVEEVLAKHEHMLQELAERDLGGRIPEALIFREVVSGESIDDRPEMKNLLEIIENPAVLGVLVIEPQRLSRGDLVDCGTIVNAFRYSNTKIKTLTMEYDLQNKMHRKFFEQELMRGNDYLEYTKEILLRGRILAVQKGAYIGNIAPFGFDKTVIDDLPSLKENEDTEAVRLVFDMYVNKDKTYLQIARHLDKIGVKPMKGDIWEKSSIRNMLKNVHYVGLVKFGTHKTEKFYENGQLVTRRSIPVDKDDIIIAQGKHKAIVTQEIFDAAQEKMDNNPRAKEGYSLKNPLAGIFFCAKCGKAMAQHPYKHARDRFECRNRNGCGSKSIPIDELMDVLAFVLEKEHLPDLEVKLKNDDGNSRSIQEKRLKAMNEELDELKMQENKQFDLLEKGFYTEDKFMQRNKELHVKMDALKSKIYEAKKVLPKEVDYEKKIIKLKDAIEGIRNDDISIESKNKLLKAIIERIDYEYIAWEGKGKIKYKLHVHLLL